MEHSSMIENSIDRRRFVDQSLTAGVALALTGLPIRARADEPAKQPPKRIKVGVIGCGSVSNVYLPNLAKCPYVELVSTCDIIPERAEKQATKVKVPHHYPHVDK